MTIKGVEYAFRWCPPGTFLMGSPESEPGRSNDEMQHQVTLTKGFWMLETQVTQAMWESVMANNPSYFRGKKLPVEGVSWNDCQEFIGKLNAIQPPTNAGGSPRFTLPTEAQWEYACRAGTTTDFFWGDTAEGGEGYLNAASQDGYPNGGLWNDSFPFFTGYKATAPVGSYKPNGWGLYDMHGNVWEWCADWYGDYQGGAVTDPVGPSRGSNRILRGGSWGLSAWGCRSADRFGYEPAYRGNCLGFRLSLVGE